MTQTSSSPSGWHGGPVGESIRCVLAGNPGPMTLDGTNTWLLSAPGSSRAVVIDPGPDDPDHLAGVRATAAECGLQIISILLTHGHLDHSAGARNLAGLTGAPVRALDPAHRYGGEGLVDGDVLDLDGLRITVVTTPGHTADSLSFLVPQLGAVLTGDTVLGRGTAVVAHPDGRLAAYLDSLVRLSRLCDQDDLTLLLPGHGPVLPRPTEVLQGYLSHRQQRLEQVRGALAAGAVTAAEVVAAVYAEVDPAVRPAAELSVLAQLTYLQEEGHLQEEGPR